MDKQRRELLKGAFGALLVYAIPFKPLAKVYNARDVSVSFNGVELRGFSQDTIITIDSTSVLHQGYGTPVFIKD